MNEDDDLFISIGDSYLTDAKRYIDPKTVLDIGCGYGRLAFALHRSGFAGRYHGMDILPRQIQWLQNNFEAGGYEFELQNIKNDRYNPKGTLDTSEIVFSPSFNPDLTLLLSVFTHMYAHDIEQYLLKLRPILTPNSIVYATFFILAGNATRRPYDFAHELNENCRYYDEKDPLHAIAYKEDWLRGLFERCGYSCRDLQYKYQDVVILALK